MLQHSARTAPILILALLLGACAAPAAAPTTAPAVDSAATQTVAAIANSNGVETSVAATLTAEPSNTPLPTDTVLPTNTALPTNTTQPSATPKPANTATVAPSATTAPKATATATRAKATGVAATKPAATKPAATQAPATKEPAAGGSVYSTASGGPQGYLSTLGCTQASGAPCQSAMPAGDIAFSIRLESAEDALLAIFVPFGLSVEKDGANQADSYMTVDAGWLSPGHYALMGTSHSFKVPGHYVVRTNGCLITEASYPACTWWTVNGTVVTFDIQ